MQILMRLSAGWQKLQRLFLKSNLFIETIGESGEVSAVKDHLYEIADDLPDGNVYQKHTFDFAEGNKNEAFLTSGKVQYVGEGGDFRKYGFNYTALSGL